MTECLDQVLIEFPMRLGFWYQMEHEKCLEMMFHSNAQIETTLSLMLILLMLLMLFKTMLIMLLMLMLMLIMLLMLVLLMLRMLLKLMLILYHVLLFGISLQNLCFQFCRIWSYFSRLFFNHNPHILDGPSPSCLSSLCEQLQQFPLNKVVSFRFMYIYLISYAFLSKSHHINHHLITIFVLKKVYQQLLHFIRSNRCISLSSGPFCCQQLGAIAI